MVQQRRHGRLRASRPSHVRHPKSYRVVCSGCGKEALVQVPPPNDKKLLCIECFSNRDI